MINNFFKDIFFESMTAMSNSCHSKSPKDTHGPVVKTGPTAGQNRSRNKNGQWHRKRSDSGTKK